MKANELRIGNFVKYEGSEKVIKSITENHVDLINNFIVPIERIEPISLTREWIKRAKNLDNFVFVAGSLVILGETFDYNGLWVGKIDYVHQLQNIYFAFNNKELEFENNGTN